MYRKTNTLTTALIDNQGVKHAPFYHKWNIYKKINDNLFILYHLNNNCTEYMPLYIHTFKFIQLRNLTDSQKFFIKYPNPEQIPTTADKLKYFRYKKSLLQREVAEYAGIDRSTYINYESNNLDYYPIDKLIRIAELFEIDVKLLLDDYNYFLYKGQGQQIRKLRKELGLTQSEFGQLYGATAGTVKRWENNRIKVSKNTWSIIFKLNFNKSFI